MHTAANTSRFLIDLSSEREFADPDSDRGLFRRIVLSKLAHTADSLQIFNDLAQLLIRFAEHSFALRDMDKLQEASRVLVNLPLNKAWQIGQYYRAIAVSRIGKTDEALSILESVADNAPIVYRARAIQTLGSIYHRQGQPDEALRLYSEAARAASSKNGRDFLTTLLINQEIASIKSEKGDHCGALADYESLSPLVRIVSRDHPLYFYFYHNELAVEFAELGRVAAASAASAIAMASPFAPAYPEWSATCDEIAAKRTSATPSVVAISRPPEAEALPQIAPQCQAKRSRKLSFNHSASGKDFFQRYVYSIPATATNVLTTISILERVLISIAPRAPPTLF